MSNYLDGWLHAVGMATVNSVNPSGNDENVCKVDVMFMGGELVLSVPRKFCYDSTGLPIFTDENDTAWLELLLGINANAKSFEGSTYSKIDITVKKVKVFRPLNDEELAAL